MIETKTDCYHYLDLNKINQWIINTKKDGVYITKDEGVDADGKFVLVNQTTTISQNGVVNRSSLIAEMLNTLYDSGVKMNENNAIEFASYEDELPIGTKIILNTLEFHGFLLNKMID